MPSRSTDWALPDQAVHAIAPAWTKHDAMLFPWPRVRPGDSGKEYARARGAADSLGMAIRA